MLRHDANIKSDYDVNYVVTWETEGEAKNQKIYPVCGQPYNITEIFMYMGVSRGVIEKEKALLK